MKYISLINHALLLATQNSLLKLEHLIRNKPVKYHSYNNFKNNYDVSLVFDDYNKQQCCKLQFYIFVNFWKWKTNKITITKSKRIIIRVKKITRNNSEIKFRIFHHNIKR